MLFGYELKKIVKRISPLLVLLLLVATVAITMTLTIFVFNDKPTNDTVTAAQQYQSLQHKIDQWDTDERTNVIEVFNTFYNEYKELNECAQWQTSNLLNHYTTKALPAFQKFDVLYQANATSISDYLLVKQQYLTYLDDIVSAMRKFFNGTYTSNDAVIEGLKINKLWENTALQAILNDYFNPQKIDDLTYQKLRLFFAEYPAGNVDNDYTDAWHYVQNQYWIAVAQTSDYLGELSQYAGFNDFIDVPTATREMTLAQYRFIHEDEDYAVPFTFGKIYNHTYNISLFDFIFTNLEMAMIPVAILVMIWTGCAFFTDVYQNTIITPIVANHKRSHLVVIKVLAVLTLALLTILILTTVYLVSGLLISNATISPDILFLFNGTTVMIMSAPNYFVLYLLDIMFKILPLVAICALLALVKTKPMVIIGMTALTYLAVVAANALLGGFWFYQFVPLLALDPLRYLGAQLFLSKMPTTYNIMYTLPVITGITIILYLCLLVRFRRRDF